MRQHSAAYPRPPRLRLQAFIEWVPVRGASHEKIDLAACHRTFQFGDLATLVRGRAPSRQTGAGP